jgi:anti-sigma factor RsiW
MNEHKPRQDAAPERAGEPPPLDEAGPDATKRPVYRAPSGRPVRASWLLAGGLFAAALTLISFFYTAQWYRAGAENRLLVAIAEEVAAHHLELEPLEVEGDSLDAVLAYFTELDFQLVPSPRLGGVGGTLMGGRYCSIQGEAAAELRYRAQDGTLSTWYEGTLAPEQLAALPDVGAGGRPFRHLVRGIDVSIWREGGLLFAGARPVGRAAPRDGGGG